MASSCDLFFRRGRIACVQPGAYRNRRGRRATSVPSVESVEWRDTLLHTHLGL
jgi:hypothetical protein